MTTLRATPSSSETAPRFAEEPMPVLAYFQDSVRRLLHDNLESVASLTFESADLWDTKYENIELLSLVDAHPETGERIRYHEVYEVFMPRHPQARTPDTTFGIHLGKVPWEAPQSSHPEVRPARRNSNRSYTISDRDGILVVEHKDMSFSRPTVRQTIEGTIEDPRALGDPLDSPIIDLLKRDIERVKMSTPVRTLSQPGHSQ